MCTWTLYSRQISNGLNVISCYSSSSPATTSNSALNHEISTSKWCAHLRIRKIPEYTEICWVIINARKCEIHLDLVFGLESLWSVQWHIPSSQSNLGWKDVWGRLCGLWMTATFIFHQSGWVSWNEISHWKEPKENKGDRKNFCCYMFWIKKCDT